MSAFKTKAFLTYRHLSLAPATPRSVRFYMNLLEKINRYGACAQLAEVFETSGIAAAARVAKDFEDGFRELCNKLNARDADGKPLAQGGDYDYLFDPLAKVETPRAQLGGIAGGDQYPSEASSEDSTNVFKKWDRREF